jgi:hypothetical protein
MPSADRVFSSPSRRRRLVQWGGLVRVSRRRPTRPLPLQPALVDDLVGRVGGASTKEAGLPKRRLEALLV